MYKLLLNIFLVLMTTAVWAADFAPGSYYEVCFTPAQQCQSSIVNHIYDAKQSIEVQAYSFTARKIANALAKAQQRGVKVSVIVDKSDLLNSSQVYLLLKQHIPVWLDKNVAIAHNKVMIFDQAAILTGSYNYTNSAEYHNAENALFIFAPSLAKQYEQNWQSRLQQSVPVTSSNLRQLQAQLASAQPYRDYGN